MANVKKKFSKEYTKNIDKVFRFVILKTGSKEVAEDLTSRVFIKGWEKTRDGSEIKNMSAYLFQIARAEISDYYRKEKKIRIVSAESAQILDDSLSQEEAYQSFLEAQEVLKGLKKIKEDEQDLLILRYVQGYSIKEIADTLNKTRGAVRVAIHRAVQALKQEMEKN